MALTADQITAQNFKDFFTQILPYLNKGNGGTSDTPLGQVAFFDDLVAPYGWLVADGSTYNIADYPDLANQYERVHGSKNFYGGNGTTTFAVPDWDAIPAEVFGNSNIICIKAIPSSEMNTYSLTERRVGTWIDGKPLYEKTLQIDVTPGTAERKWYDLINLSALNIGVFVSADGRWNDAGTSKDFQWSDTLVHTELAFVASKLRMVTTGITTRMQGFITIRYTKTTDV